MWALVLFMCPSPAHTCRAQCDVLVIPQRVTIIPNKLLSHVCVIFLLLFVLVLHVLAILALVLALLALLVLVVVVVAAGNRAHFRNMNFSFVI